MALERDLHDLLFEHDCVIVPGFGGFLAHYRPARIDEQRRVIHPPAKELSFNRHLTRHDGLLVDRLIRREGLEYQAAKGQVEEELGQWRQMLQRQGRLELPRIGTFFHDAEGNLQFDPDRRVNYLKDAFGLRSVAAVPVARPGLKGKVIPLLAKEHEAAQGDGRRIPAFLAVAATIAVLLTAATWWAVGHSGDTGLAWGSFDLVRASAPSLYVLPSAPPETAAPGTGAEVLPWKAPEDRTGIAELPIAGPEFRSVAVNLGQAPAKAVPESTAVAMPEVQVRFHIIGGCFLEKENADRFVAELQAKGFAASLIDKKGGLYRVAYGSYPLRSTALEALQAVRKEEAPNAWMLVK